MKNNRYYSKREKARKKKQSIVYKVQSIAKMALLLLMPLSVYVIMVLDFTNVFRLSWLLN